MRITDNVSVVSPSLIGRETELATLAELLNQTASGPGHIAYLAGEAGIGKSRLATEVKSIAAQLGFRIVQGRCFEQDRTFPYAPLVDLLRGFCIGRSTDELMESFGPTAIELVKIFPELAVYLSDIAPNSMLDPEQDKHRIFQALVQFMNRIIAKTRAHLGSPLLLIIDDLHWCDDTSLEWLLYLARQLESQPILVVLTYRNNEIQPSLNQLLAVFDRTAFAHEVSLKRLTRAELDTMLCAIFSLAQSPRAEFLNSLYELTEGNPFFIEEVLKSLVALGDIFQVSGTWTRKRLSELQIPRTIQVAVHQRTRQLSPATQHVLTLSAVMGQRFDFSVLQALTQQSETALLQQIKDLVAAQLVIEEPALSHTEITEGTFAFRHALTREAIYSELLVRERKLLHRAIAESIEACYSSSLEAHISDLAYHCYEAGLWMQALDWSKQAGDSARRLYANSEALRHYVRARECAERLEDSEQVAPLDQIIGQVHHARGAFSQALESYACALQATSDPARRAVLKAEMGAAFVSLADERGITYLQEALLELNVETQSRETAFTMLWMGRYFHLRAQYTQALDYLQRALAGTLDDTNMYGFISSALMFSGRFEESMEWARRAVREGEAKQSWRTVAFGYIYLSTNPKVL